MARRHDPRDAHLRSPDTFPAGPDLDAAVQRRLQRDFAAAQPSERARLKRVHPWSTSPVWTMSLMAQPIHGWRACHLRLSWTDGVWLCQIDGMSDDRAYWWCTATGHTLAEAFCRAFVQEQEP